MEDKELNLLNNVQFRFDIHKIPNASFEIQNVIMPSIQLDSPFLPSPRRDIPMPGTKINFDPLNITFLVDEKMNNYLEIYKWMVEMQSNNDPKTWRSDAVLTIFTGQMNPSRILRFVGLVPTLLTELSFTSSDPDVTRVESTVSFQFEYFDFPSEHELVGTV